MHPFELMVLAILFVLVLMVGFRVFFPTQETPPDDYHRQNYPANYPPPYYPPYVPPTYDPLRAQLAREARQTAYARFVIVVVVLALIVYRVLLSEQPPPEPPTVERPAQRPI